MSPKSPGASKALPRQQPGGGTGPGSRVTSSPHNEDGDRDVLCCPGRNWRHEGSRAAPDCLKQRHGQWDLSLTHPFSFACPTASREQTGTPWTQECSLCPKGGCDLGGLPLFSGLTQHLPPQPPPWAQLSTLVPEEGDASTKGHREMTEPVGSARQLLPKRRHEPCHGAHIKQVKGPGVPA